MKQPPNIKRSYDAHGNRIDRSRDVLVEIPPPICYTQPHHPPILGGRK